MIYRFVIISDEVSDFRRDIEIDASATFLQLQNAILASVGYKSDEVTRFLLTDEKWRPKQEILLVDMGLTKSDEELYLMEETALDDLLEEEGDRLLFNFDLIGDRYFYMELREIRLNEYLKEARVVRAKGEPPVQESNIEELLTATDTKKALDSTTLKIERQREQESEELLESFQSDTFEESDLDAEGFELTGGDDEL